MCNNSAYARLRLRDVQMIQNSILQNWAQSIIVGGTESCKAIPLYFLEDVGGIHSFKTNVEGWVGGIKDAHLVQSSFCRNVLMTWLKYAKAEWCCVDAK